ncbi:MAG: hypothetical protein FWC95_03010 [Defluviitaleaceae bacterium]|nr:hypothetical protein [Defluviitaleaceae bacterium]
MNSKPAALHISVPILQPTVDMWLINCKLGLVDLYCDIMYTQNIGGC